MIRRRYDYQAPADVPSAVALLAEDAGDTAILSGGTWLVPEMSKGVRRPDRVVDLRRASLGGVQSENGTIVIGATATYSQVLGAHAVPGLLRTVAAGITGGAQIHNQGTLAGSVVYASPSSDAPGALTALGATVRLESADGIRDVSVRDFVRGPFASDVRPGELVTAIRVPRPAPGTRFGYVKFKLVQGSWPIVTAACVADADGTVRSLTVGGAAVRPVVVPLEGDPDLHEIEASARAAITEPWSDALADGAYRQRIAGTIAKRAVLAARAEEGAAT